MVIAVSRLVDYCEFISILRGNNTISKDVITIVCFDNLLMLEKIDISLCCHNNKMANDCCTRILVYWPSFYIFYGVLLYWWCLPILACYYRLIVDKALFINPHIAIFFDKQPGSITHLLLPQATMTVCAPYKSLD